jgi:hypothetical protein
LFLPRLARHYFYYYPTTSELAKIIHFPAFTIINGSANEATPGDGSEPGLSVAAAEILAARPPQSFTTLHL